MFFLVSTRNVLCNSNRSFYYRNQCVFFIDFLSRLWFDPLTRMTRILPSEHLWISTAETWTYKHSFCDVILLFMLRDEDITSSSASISPTGRTGEKKVSLNFHLHVVWGGTIRAKKWMRTRDKWDSMSEKKKKIRVICIVMRWAPLTCARKVDGQKNSSKKPRREGKKEKYIKLFMRFLWVNPSRNGEIYVLAKAARGNWRRKTEMATESHRK